MPAETDETPVVGEGVIVASWGDGLAPTDGVDVPPFNPIFNTNVGDEMMRRAAMGPDGKVNNRIRTELMTALKSPRPGRASYAMGKVTLHTALYSQEERASGGDKLLAVSPVASFAARCTGCA